MSNLTCEYCDYVANTLRGLKIHASRKHKEEMLSDKEARAKDPGWQPTPVMEEPPVVPEPELETDKQGNVGVGVSHANDVTTGSGLAQSHEEPPAVPEPEAELGLEPTPVPQEVGIKEIFIGSRILLDGVFWWKGPEAYEDKLAISMECRVVDRIFQNEFMYLQLESFDSEWCCLESQVLDGTVKLLSLKDPKEQPMDLSVTMPTTVAMEEMNKARLDYLEACKKYTDARDAKLEAERLYKAADSETRKPILTYIDKYGRESAPGKGDRLLKDGGFDVHHTFAEGKVTIKREEQEIIEWCTANGHIQAIKPALNVEAWDSLVEKGAVPSEFLIKVQTPVKGKNSRRLLITNTLDKS